jgi:polyisoprenoid-binding protein YceI
MKLIAIAIILALFSTEAMSQDKCFTKNGKVTFFSKTPLEDIEAKNRNAVSVLDKTTGQVEVSLLMKGFEFDKALMQEHFNENYVESDKFPKSVFKGSVNDLKDLDFSKDGKYKTSVSGKLTLHGETKDITAPATFVVNNGNVSVSSEFNVILEDYKISIPSIASDKISKAIKIDLEFNYQPLKQQ